MSKMKMEIPRKCHNHSPSEVPEDMRENKAFNPYGLNALFFLMSSGISSQLQKITFGFFV